jgi:hypothetical protein
MQKGQRFRFVAIVGLVVALTSAGFALAGGDTFDTSGEPQTTVCPPAGDTTEDTNGDTTEDTNGDTTEDTDGDTTEDTNGDTTGDTVDEGDQDDPADCEDPADEADNSNDAEAPTDEGQTVDQAATETSPERIAECTAAAGLNVGDAPSEKPVGGELKGLENAISHVLWNCMRNDNDGLVNALTHLSANLEAKQLRDEAKAERKAAHDEAKAERQAAHEAVKAARALARAS